MIDEVWKDFFKDHQTERVLNSSEVWRNYSQAEIARDQLREKRAMEKKLDEENSLMDSIEEFRAKVASDPALKTYFKKVAKILEENPEIKAKADPNFVAGLSLLDFED